MARLKRDVQAFCTWRQDADGVWWTACDNAHQFTTDGPIENKHAYCCYCGDRLRAVRVGERVGESFNRALHEAWRR